MFLSVVCYVAGDMCIKRYLRDIPSIEVVFFRNLFGLLLIGLMPYSKPLIWIGGKFWLLLSRGVLGFLSLSLFYYLIANAPLANAVVFLQSATIFSAIIALIAIKERLSAAQAAAIVLGFAGICLVVNPTVSMSRYDLLGLALGVVSALAHTSVKELRRFYDSRSIVFSYLLVGVMLPLLLMIAGRSFSAKSYGFVVAGFVDPGSTAVAFLLVVAATTTVGQLLKTKAYSMEKVGVLGTIGYSRIGFALIAGVMLGDAYPNPVVFLGIVMIGLAVTLVSYRHGGGRQHASRVAPGKHCQCVVTSMD